MSSFFRVSLWHIAETVAGCGGYSIITLFFPVPFVVDAANILFCSKPAAITIISCKCYT